MYTLEVTLNPETENTLATLDISWEGQAYSEIYRIGYTPGRSIVDAIQGFCSWYDLACLGVARSEDGTLLARIATHNRERLEELFLS
jgi:hypothetical protein